MSELFATQVDFAKYQRFMNRMVGRACPISVFNAQGELVWGEEMPGNPELARHLAQAERQPPPVQRLLREDGEGEHLERALQHLGSGFVHRRSFRRSTRE